MQIPYLFSLLVLPSVVMAAEVQLIHCPDGSACPVGQTCLPSAPTGSSKCGSLPREEFDNKKLVVGLPSMSFGNTSVNLLASRDGQQSPMCPSATYCFGYCCRPISGNVNKAVCCLHQSCCPEKSNCCTDLYSRVWCCGRRDRCAGEYMYCYGGAQSISPAAATLGLLFLLVLSKLFLERGI